MKGTSAGGSAKQVAIVNIKGRLCLYVVKILITWEVSSDEVLASQEVHDISVAIGMDPDSDDLSQLRYGKICILADADSDGFAISPLCFVLYLFVISRH